MSEREIFTIGHWTCPQETFLEPLRAAGVELIADVRAQPGSRRNPQFGRDAMPNWLHEAGIDYLHLAELGGRRPKQPVDTAINAGWQNASFKNYADYTLTQPYREGTTPIASRHSGLACSAGRCRPTLTAFALWFRLTTLVTASASTPPRPPSGDRTASIST